MSNLSARHQLVCAIVQRHPRSVVALAEAAGVPLPEHDDVMPAPDARLMQDGDTVYSDATVRLLRKGAPVFFASVEMQRRYEKGKYATLHAYHGSGVRGVDAGGHLFLRAIVEEVPKAMLGEVLQPDMREKLRGLEWFREYEAEVKAEAKTAAEAAVAAEVGAAAEAKVAKAVAGNLKDFLVLRGGDAPSEHALNTISGCTNTDMIEAWLKRAYLGETSAQLFPEPKPR